MAEADQERPEGLLEESARLATVVIDDHAEDTPKSSTTLEPTCWGSEWDLRPSVITVFLACCCANCPAFPAQTFGRNSSDFPLTLMLGGVISKGFRLRSVRILNHQAALKNYYFVMPF